MVVAWRPPRERQTAGAGRVRGLEVVDKPGRCTVEGVAGIIVNLIGRRGEQQRCCRREVGWDIRRDEIYRSRNVAGKTRIRALGGVKEGKGLEVGRKGAEVKRRGRRDLGDRKGIGDM